MGIFEIKNISGNDLEIKEFGLVIPNNEIVDLLDYNKAINSDEVNNFLTINYIVRIIDNVPVNSSQTYSNVANSNLDLNNYTIYNVPTPTGNTDIVNKIYVDVNTADKLSISGGTIYGNLVINGDFFISGKSYIIETTDLKIKDNLITINSGETGAGVSAGIAGFEIDRGSLEKYVFIFDESSDTFRVGLSSSTQAITTREDLPSANFIPRWNNVSKIWETTGNISINGNNILRTYTPNYEQYVTYDGHIPNKKYVDIQDTSGITAFNWGNHALAGYVLSSNTNGLSISGGTIYGSLNIKNNLNISGITNLYSDLNVYTSINTNSLIVSGQSIFLKNINYDTNVVAYVTGTTFYIQSSHLLILVDSNYTSKNIYLPSSIGVKQITIKDATSKSNYNNITINTINSNVIVKNDIPVSNIIINTNGLSYTLFSDGNNSWYVV
jgi:hypothetical protein